MSHALIATLARLSPAERALFLNPSTHAQSLTSLIGRALAARDPTTALALADRRCRIRPRASARDHVLRAEAARRSGDWDAATAAILRACELDPTDAAVNLGVIAIVGGDQAADAARMIIASDQAEPAAVIRAIDCLAERGEIILGTIISRGSRLTGWVSWPAGETLTMQSDLEAGRARALASAADHPLAVPGRHGATLAFERGSHEPTFLTFTCEGRGASLTLHAPPRNDRRVTSWPRPRAGGADALNVIVPVYEDAERTGACLDSLAAQVLPGIRLTTIVVDDCSPNARLVEDVGRRARIGEVRLLSQRMNRGFAASVNAAAAQAPHGDILLLNADTLLPPGALARLCRAAAVPGVGTVTPLSNNGEVTSFPRANVLNDLPSYAVLMDWDRAAARDGGPVIDIPNGIGFCLLIRRACWDALGGLSLAFGRGYYEDVDFCLRARARGFRNVCAPNVVVGHAGSRSFRAGKRALVVRNSRILEARHPGYEAEHTAFLHAAPLRPAMARIERRLVPDMHRVLIVAARAAADRTAAARGAELAVDGCPALLGRLEQRPAGPALALRSATGGVPQSLAFELGSGDGPAALGAYLDRAALRRIELIDPEACPAASLAILEQLGRPIDPHRQGPLTPEAAARLDRLARRGGRIICRDSMALAVARADHPGASIVRPPTLPQQSRRYASSAATLAVLSPVACAGSLQLIAGLSRRAPPGAAIRVLGATLDDLSLMAIGSVFVSGPVAPEDLPDALARLAPRAVLLPYRAGWFRDYEVAAAVAPCRGAYFDWSRGRHRARAGDLALNPDLDDGAVAERVLAWFGDMVPGKLDAQRDRSA